MYRTMSKLAVVETACYFEVKIHQDCLIETVFVAADAVVDDDDEVSFARWKKQLMQKGWWK